MYLYKFSTSVCFLCHPLQLKQQIYALSRVICHLFQAELSLYTLQMVQDHNKWLILQGISECLSIKCPNKLVCQSFFFFFLSPVSLMS